MNTSSPLLINLPHPYTPPHVHRKRKPPEWFLNSLTSVVPVTLCPSRLHWTCQSTHHVRGQKRLNAPRQAVFFFCCCCLFVCLFSLIWGSIVSFLYFISLFKGLSRVFSNNTAQKHQFVGVQPSLRLNSHIHTWLLEMQSLHFMDRVW